MVAPQASATADALAGARIVLVLSSLELGGAERQAVLLAGYLQRQCAAHVHIVGLGQPGRVAELCLEQGLPCMSLPRVESRFSLRTWWRLSAVARALASLRPDLLLCYAMPANLLCAFAQRSGARASIWNQRDEGLSRAAAWLERRALDRATSCLANSPAGASFITRVHPRGAAAAIAVVANGVALPEPVLERPAWRERLGVSAECLVVCMLANLSHHKDHATLLRAWREVLAQIQPRRVLLVLAGRHDAAYPALRAEIAADVGLAGSVLMPGKVDDVGGLLAAADIAVFSSRSEGCPNAVLECTAAGLALAASDIPGIRSLLGAHAHSLLAPPGDAHALATCILRLCRDDALRSQQGASNREHISAHFSPATMLTATRAVLARTLSGAAGVAATAEER